MNYDVTIEYQLDDATMAMVRKMLTKTPNSLPGKLDRLDRQLDKLIGSKRVNSGVYQNAKIRDVSWEFPMPVQAEIAKAALKEHRYTVVVSRMDEAFWAKRQARVEGTEPKISGESPETNKKLN
jgi:hypothetical protein